jgi:predicted DNA binding protein
MPLLWVRGETEDSVTQTLQNDPSVENVECLTVFEDEQLYRMAWTGQVELILQMLTSAEATILDAYGTGEQWSLRILYPSRDALSTTVEFGKKHGVTFDITTIRQVDGEPAGRYGLSGAQYEALETAVKRGYYEIPRKNNLDDIAAEFDISHQALSERMRRATRALIEDTILIKP